MNQLSCREREYYELALNRKQKSLAKRLAQLPRDERLYNDDQLSELDNRNPSAAFVVLAMADDLAAAQDDP